MLLFLSVMEKSINYNSKLLINIMQLISLYPGLMPSNSSFTRAVPPLHDIADVIQLCRDDTVKVQQCKKFLLDYLRHVSSRSSADSQPLVLYHSVVTCFDCEV